MGFSPGSTHPLHRRWEERGASAPRRATQNPWALAPDGTSTAAPPIARFSPTINTADPGIRSRAFFSRGGSSPAIAPMIRELTASPAQPQVIANPIAVPVIRGKLCPQSPASSETPAPSKVPRETPAPPPCRLVRPQHQERRDRHRHDATSVTSSPEHESESAKPRPGQPAIPAQIPATECSAPSPRESLAQSDAAEASSTHQLRNQYRETKVPSISSSGLPRIGPTSASTNAALPVGAGIGVNA